MRYEMSWASCAAMLMLCGCAGGTRAPVPIPVAPAVMVCPALPALPLLLQTPPARPAGGYLSTLPLPPSKTQSGMRPR